MTIKHLLLQAPGFLIFAGCTSTYTTESTYEASEIGVSKKVVRCRVLEAREITIRDKDVVEGAAGLGAATGAIGAGIGGSTIGSGGAGTAAATAGIGLVGGLIGQAIGRKVGEKTGSRAGVEYAVILTDGEERTLVQDLAEGDRVITPGETCRLQLAYDDRSMMWTGPARVLPTEHFTEEIAAPKRTTFTRPSSPENKPE